jgi:tetratricopeptide (TPR) repeat protein
MNRVAWLFIALGILICAPAAAQHDAHAAEAAAASDSAIALFNNLGAHSRTVTTSSARAQSYFDQGLRLAWAFGMPEAHRSFEVAIASDPQCAKCHWGLAWSLGPYVNGAMDSAGAVRAHRHAAEAARLADNASAVERALIDALRVRYTAVPTRSERARLDTLYMLAMRDVAQRFPDDLDVATLYAESMMVLRPWNYWTAAGEPEPGVDELIRTLESVLARDLAHPGACHLFIHATEASLEPQRAEPCADLLMDGMPGASHMRHMPSHTYMRTGRYGDAVRSNQLAWIADQQARHGGATAIYPTHNLHMLLFAASYDGQSAVAIQAARDLARLAPGSALHLPLVLARFGRWDEILELPMSPAAFPAAVLSYARGLAQVRTNRLPAARMSLAGVEAQVRDNPNHGNHTLLGLARAILAAEIHVAEGKPEDAVRVLETARVIETDSIGYSEPEGWLVPLRQVLGAVLLDAGRAAEAEAAYRGELEAHPENGWSLFGLHRALVAQGKDMEAAVVLEGFRRAWSRADVHLTGSRF